MEVFLFLEKFEEQFVRPAVDVPIDRAQIVARGVVAIIGELQAGAELVRAAFGAALAGVGPAREQVQAFELGEEDGVKEHRRGTYEGKQQVASSSVGSG